MKKLAILLLAGAVVGLTSCGSNENNASKEQIDSMATVRTDTMQATLKAQNDSLINAMAKMRADSALRADSISKAMSMMPKTSTPATSGRKVTKTKTTTSGGTKNNTETQNNSSSTRTITKDQEQQQNNKFNER
jgi:hypothetical protein